MDKEMSSNYARKKQVEQHKIGGGDSGGYELVNMAWLLKRQQLGAGVLEAIGII